MITGDRSAGLYRLARPFGGQAAAAEHVGRHGSRGGKLKWQKETGVGGDEGARYQLPYIYVVQSP